MPPPPLEIIFKTKGVDNLLKSLNKSSQAFSALHRAATGSGGMNTSLNSATANLKGAASVMRSAAADLAQTVANLKSATAGLKNAGSGSGARKGKFSPPKLPPLPKWAQVPMSNAQKIAQFQGYASQAQAAGNPAAAAHWQQQIKKLHPQTFGQKLSNAIMTSRVGMGGKGGMQIMPLINRLTALLPPMAQAVVGVVLATVAVGKALYDVSVKAAEAAVAFGKLSLQLGSGVGTTARLSGLSREMGMDPAQMGQMAKAFQEKLQDPEAAAWASRLGIGYNAPGGKGNQDWGQQLERAIEGLRAIKNPVERTRIARELGLEPALNAAMVSQRQHAISQGDAKITEKIMGGDAAQKAADMMNSIGRVGDAFMNIVNAIGSAFSGEITDFANSVADFFNFIAKIIADNKDTFRVLLEAIFPLFAVIDSVIRIINALNDIRQGNMKRAWEDMVDPEHHKDMDNKLSDLKGAIQENTASQQKLAGIYGRSERQGRAIPAGLGAEGLRRALEAGGIGGLSAF